MIKIEELQEGNWVETSKDYPDSGIEKWRVSEVSSIDRTVSCWKRNWFGKRVFRRFRENEIYPSKITENYLNKRFKNYGTTRKIWFHKEQLNNSSIEAVNTGYKVSFLFNPADKYCEVVVNFIHELQNEYEGCFGEKLK